MDDIKVKGRGLPAPVVVWNADSFGVRIRIDDELNPEAWIEVTIPLQALAKMQGEVVASIFAVLGGQ